MLESKIKLKSCREDFCCCLSLKVVLLPYKILLLNLMTHYRNQSGFIYIIFGGKRTRSGQSDNIEKLYFGIYVANDFELVVVKLF